jgi:hypothetical protein
MLLRLWLRFRLNKDRYVIDRVNPKNSLRVYIPPGCEECQECLRNNVLLFHIQRLFKDLVGPKQASKPNRIRRVLNAVLTMGSVLVAIGQASSPNLNSCLRRFLRLHPVPENGGPKQLGAPSEMVSGSFHQAYGLVSTDPEFGTCVASGVNPRSRGCRRVTLPDSCAEERASIFLRQHDRDDTLGDCRIGRI